MKTCNTCKKEFPKTTEYFFNKVIKQKLSNGKTAVYNCLRSDCKKCHGKKGMEIKIKKRCVQLKCNVSDYRENWKKQYSETRTHFKEFKNYPLDTRKRMNQYKIQGKDISTYENYRKLGRFKLSQIRRKYDYGNVNIVSKKQLSRSHIDNLTDAYIALTLNKKVSELPKEMIETKRLIIKLKRETNGK